MRLTINPGRSRSGRKNTERDGTTADRPVGDCVVCGSKDVELDFHHWCYRDDIGCRVCRICHEHAHNGKRCQPSQTAGNQWVVNCFRRLFERYSENHAWTAEERVFKQLNIPQQYRRSFSDIVQEADE